MTCMRSIITAVLLLFANGIQARTCEVLKKEPGSITFVVDKDLPKPSFNLNFTPTDRSSEKLVRLYREKGKEGIVAKSFGDGTFNVLGRSPFFDMMVSAYADHHAIELSPDVIWILISQAFGHHIGKNPEQYRQILVSHEGRMSLSVKTDTDILSEETDWNKLIDNLTKQICDNTKGDIADVITADFSTTGPVERMASQVVLMDAMKWFFEYNVFRLSCGIPQITLKGTPEDWARIREKTMKLSDYGLEWWTDSLIPVLTEFENAAKGKPDSSFWKSIVCKEQPDIVRGPGCSGKGGTMIDGWFLNFLPFDNRGRTPKTVSTNHEFLAETVQVPFNYVEVYSNHIDTTSMELWAGLVGIEETPETQVLNMKIGWLVRDASGDPKELTIEPEADYENGIIDITVVEVPEWLKKVKSVKQLSIHFKNKVLIPEWMDHLQIGSFSVYGNPTLEEESELKKRFKNIIIVR